MTTEHLSGSAPTEATSYTAVPAAVDFPGTLEHEILDFWDNHATFEASLAQTLDGKPWTFYEGPPTANGMPGTHHIEARVQGRLPRFKTMQGFRVDRKAGWDTTACPSSWPSRRSSASTASPRSRPTASRRSTPSAASRWDATSTRSPT